MLNSLLTNFPTKLFFKGNRGDNLQFYASASSQYFSKTLKGSLFYVLSLLWGLI